MRTTRAAAVAIALGGLWPASCGTMAQPLPPPGPPAPDTGDRIVAYSWVPVTPAADRLICAVKVDRRRYDIQQVAAQLRALPPGHRAIRLWKWADADLTRHPEDRCRRPDGRPTEYWYPQPSAGLELVRARWRDFLVQLHRTGVPLDEVIVDYERGYDMWGGMAGSDKVAHLTAIQNDPRFRGVSSREGGELTTLERVHDFRNSQDYLVWNAVMHGVVDAALQAAIYEPLRQVYPGARCSNFNSFRIRRDAAIPGPGGAYQWSESDGFGTHNTISAYGRVAAAWRLPLREGKPLGRTAYSGLLYMIKRVESVSKSSSRPLKVWVAPREMPIPRGSLLTGSVYHDELIRHLVVRRYGLILWNGDPGGGDDEKSLHLNGILNECAARTGETGSSQPHETAWSATVIQSTTSTVSITFGTRRRARSVSG
ncbi:MAG: hypothetical protein ACYTGD_18120 [Planctomycetota bacterium]